MLARRHSRRLSSLSLFGPTPNFSTQMMPRTPFLALLLLTPWLPACGPNEPEVGPAEVMSSSMPRSDDPRVVRLRSALGTGRADLAGDLMPAVRALDLGVEGDLLDARYAALTGQAVEASRLVEAARAVAPADPRVYATAAEIAAGGERLSLAREELRMGFERCGTTPELRRARGVLAISTPGDLGAARRGLADLDAARAADPSLPFLDWPSSEACRLVGQAARGENNAVAEKLLRRSLELDGGNRYAGEALGELLISVSRWEEGLEILTGLLADGALLGSKVAEYEKGAAMAYLMIEDRGQALEHLVRARNLGMPDELLGSGAAILDAAMEEALAAGRAALADGHHAAAVASVRLALKYSPDSDLARVELGIAQGAQLVDEGLEFLRDVEYLEAALRFESAIELDPDSLQAHTFLGSSRFALEEYTRAASAWHWVVDTARTERLRLPEAVHLKLAQALLMAGSGKEARQVLADYLLLEPNGPWTQDTLRFQAQLEEQER